METNGNLSVFPYPKEKPASARDAGIAVRKQSIPITVISDGKLLRDNLKKAGKDENWVSRTLSARGAGIGDTLLLTVDREDRIVWFEKEGKA